MEFSVTTTTTISTERMSDLLCCGMECGGYGDFEIVGYEPEAMSEACEFPHIEMPFLGGAVLMKDKYGDSDKVHRLDLEAMKRGLQVMAEKQPGAVRDLIDENEDVITGTIFIQCALLGEIIYG